MLINAINLPTVGEESKRRLNSTTFAEWLRHHGPTHAYVEAAQPMAKQGVSSTFRYGRAAGAAEGVIAACKVPMTLVTPRMWKTHFRLDASKENARALAIQLVPAAADVLQLVKHHHRAEAILIGVFDLTKGMAG